MRTAIPSTKTETLTKGGGPSAGFGRQAARGGGDFETPAMADPGPEGPERPAVIWLWRLTWCSRLSGHYEHHPVLEDAPKTTVTALGIPATRSTWG